MPAFIHRHRQILLLVLSVTLLLCSLASLGMYGRQQTLTCQRSTEAVVRCTQQISWFKLFPLGAAHVLSSPHLAKTEMDCRTDGETGAYECYSDSVQLITPHETIPISGFFNEATARATVDRLNQFFDSTEQQLVIESQNGITPILGLACVVVPFLICGIGLLAVVIPRFTLKRT